MSTADAIILTVLAAFLLLEVRSMLRRRSRIKRSDSKGYSCSGCCSGCAGCPGCAGGRKTSPSEEKIESSNV